MSSFMVKLWIVCPLCPDSKPSSITVLSVLFCKDSCGHPANITFTVSASYMSQYFEMHSLLCNTPFTILCARGCLPTDPALSGDIYDKTALLVRLTVTTGPCHIQNSVFGLIILFLFTNSCHQMSGLHESLTRSAESLVKPEHWKLSRRSFSSLVNTFGQVDELPPGRWVPEGVQSSTGEQQRRH